MNRLSMFNIMILFPNTYKYPTNYQIIYFCKCTTLKSLELVCEKTNFPNPSVKEALNNMEIEELNEHTPFYPKPFLPSNGQ